MAIITDSDKFKVEVYCTVPFDHVEMIGDIKYPCCPAWNQYTGESGSVETAWRSKTFQLFRQEMLGTRVRCWSGCPARHRGTVSRTDIENPKLKHLKVSFDKTCNLRCIMCRDNKIITDREEVFQKIQEVESLGTEIQTITLSGQGEVFASPELRGWLENFPFSKFPNLEEVCIATNLQLLDKQQWDRIEKLQKYIKIIQVSIDAATKETYEKIRRGGKWKRLLTNLEYIQSAFPDKNVKASMVVQQDNFQEIEKFVETFLQYGITDYLFMTVNHWEDVQDFDQIRLGDQEVEEAFKALDRVREKYPGIRVDAVV